MAEYPGIAARGYMAEKWHRYGRALPMTWEKESAILVSFTSGFGRIRLFFLSQLGNCETGVKFGPRRAEP